MCFILHHWLPWVLLSSWPRWKVLVILCPTSKKCNCSCPRVLGLWLKPGVLELRNDTRWQSCVGKLPQHGFLPASPCGTWWFICRKHAFELQDACVSEFVVPCQGEGQNALCISWLCSQAEEFSMTPDLWGLPGKTHAYSDMRLWNGAPGWWESPFITINALCYRLINMSISFSPFSPFLSFCLLFSSSGSFCESPTW